MYKYFDVELSTQDLKYVKRYSLPFEIKNNEIPYDNILCFAKNFFIKDFFNFIENNRKSNNWDPLNPYSSSDINISIFDRYGNEEILRNTIEDKNQK